MWIPLLVPLSLIMLFLTPVRTESTGRTAELAEFTRRVDAYMAIHRRLVWDRPQMPSADDPANVRASQQQLASRIRAVRHGARQGDIMTPATGAIIRSQLQEAMRGGVSNAVNSSDDGAPAPFTLALHAAYPDGARDVRLPPRVTAMLPVLPPELEFRLIGTHLALFDREADIIVDYIADVL